MSTLSLTIFLSEIAVEVYEGYIYFSIYRKRNKIIKFLWKCRFLILLI